MKRTILKIAIFALVYIFCPEHSWSQVSTKPMIVVSQVSKKSLTLHWKGFDHGEIRYDANFNRWIEWDPRHKQVQPVSLTPVLIGKNKIPAYALPGNTMAESCKNEYVILTNHSDAIQISGPCGEDKALKDFLDSYELPNHTRAIEAVSKNHWKNYGRF